MLLLKFVPKFALVGFGRGHYILIISSVASYRLFALVVMT
jgi:hypothetical protein